MDVFATAESVGGVKTLPAHPRDHRTDAAGNGQTGLLSSAHRSSVSVGRRNRRSLLRARTEVRLGFFHWRDVVVLRCNEIKGRCSVLSNGLHFAFHSLILN